MKKTKIAEAPYKAIDWLVAKAEGFIMVMTYGGPHLYVRKVHSFEDDLKWGPTTNPAQAWPIIEREYISIDQRRGEPCRAFMGVPARHEHTMFAQEGRPLLAAMRCYCVSVHGEEAEVPEELLA